MTATSMSPLVSWVMALIAIVSTFVWRAALAGWIDTSSPRYDYAEPFIAVWTGTLWVAILVLAGAGAVTDRGWRWLSAMAVLPISLLGWLLFQALLSGLGDGMISFAGLVFGIVSGAQLVLLVAWLAYSIRRGTLIA